MNFKALGLIDPLINAVNEMGYSEPTPIQAQTIPVILRGHDLLASAQTGTGKTASFVLPILQQTNQKPRSKPRGTKVLILTPTRELAAQVYDNIIQYGRHLPLRAEVVFGGVKINPQIRKLSVGVELLVATPGRLLDLQKQGALRLDDVDTLVLDEADRMLDMGFIHDIKRIIKLLPSKRQNLMFSATFSTEIRTLAKSILNQPLEIDVALRNTTAVSVKQYIHPVDKNRKHALLSHLIHKNKWGQTLVFSRTKHGANKLVKQLAESQIHSAAIHGNKSQSQRTKALADFKTGKVHILVATDIAARGIDIEKLPCVVNFDLPQVPEDYVHRIGRTGRAGETGLAVSLVSADEATQLQSIEKLMKQKLDRISIDEFEPQHHLPAFVAPSSPNKSGINKKRGYGSNPQKARKTFGRTPKKV
ncbi:DEAD/DEAH box helicase [Legionella spiritensis]|uniref:DEAD-box ATP-dependent RNA helicase RhpA n=1 Tax=Legionella spiritensis TaxID=452 RepID=A0A0W0YWA1_LEGSP|nr:DEAD/DEAH box helicase [Legionella spiritensis]KTD61145.1 ATP-dependent RNA helicase RhlE [Legionella spiritensis]SNV45194.1 ATP-dependent RNA helicase RhlE [Legionella spiritensis]